MVLFSVSNSALLPVSCDKLDTSRREPALEHPWTLRLLTDISKTKFRNPFSILSEVDKHQWLFFFCGYIAWTWDSFDFFTVSLTVTEIAADFGVANSDVSWVRRGPQSKFKHA